MTSLGIDEAFGTILSSSGTPTEPFATRLILRAQESLTDNGFTQMISTSTQVAKYSQPIDRESAREMLTQRMHPPQAEAEQQGPRAPVERIAKPHSSTPEQIPTSPTTRAIAGKVTRGLLRALIGPPPRQRRRYWAWPKQETK